MTNIRLNLDECRDKYCPLLLRPVTEEDCRHLSEHSQIMSKIIKDNPGISEVRALTLAFQTQLKL